MTEVSLNRMNDAAEETSVDTALVSSSHNPVTVAVNGNRDGPEATLVEEPAERYVLETPEERKGRRFSHLVLYITTFNVSLGFSIVLTGVWPYMRQLEPGVSKDMLGWVIAANPIGQMVASPLLGLWSNKAKSNRGAFITTMTLFALGNFLYAILNIFGTAARAVMIISRLLVGISAGNLACIRSYISASTTVKERTSAVSFTSAAQAIGFIIGPAIQTALVVAFSRDTSGAFNSTSVMEEEVVSNTGIQWNMFTATGWLSCFLGLVNLILFLPCIYQEYKIGTKEAHYLQRAASDEASKFPKPDYVALSGILFTFFVAVTIYVLTETVMVPMCMDLYAWTDERAITVVGTGLSIAAVLTFIIFITLSFITKILDDRIFLVFSSLALVISMIILIPMGGTYPKIKNCTSTDLFTSHVNETISIGDPLHLTSPSDTSIHGVTDELNYPTTATGNAVVQETFDNKSLGNVDPPFLLLRNTTREPVLLAASESEGHTFLPSETDSSSRALKRERRHVLPGGNCEDTGCPPEQEWCFYTPIIEKSQLGIGCLFAVFGYPVSFTITSALYSKILGPKPQGVWMGILIGSGSLSRATAPIAVSYIYTELGTRWTFGILACVMVIALVTDVIIYKRLVPMNILKR